MRFEGFYASFSPSFHPVTHCSFTDSQGDSYVFLLPALLFQLPGLFASFFSPIGFLWCSHTSYSITLYLLLPRSVKRWRFICRHQKPIPAIISGKTLFPKKCL